MAVMDYVNELKNQRDLLADILSEKGVTASRSEKFNTLIPKVRDISGGGTCGGMRFSEHNLLTGITLFNSDYATTVKDGNTVRIDINSTESVTWFNLTGAIPLNPKKCYKISVNNNWNGFGRLGISNTYDSSFGEMTGNDPFGKNGSKCGRNALGDFYDDFNDTTTNLDGDNHVMNSDNTRDKIFRIIPHSNTETVVNSSLWFCTDETYNDLRESFSIELALYEQI